MSTFDALVISATEALFNTITPTMVTYKNKNDVTRTIEAILFYIAKEPKNKQMRARHPLVNIIVRNNSTTGISSGEIDEAGDKVELPIRRNHTSKKYFSIKSILEQNDGFLKLEMR